MKNLEARDFEVEIRTEYTEEKYSLVGHAVLYNSRTDIGPFDEIIEFGALDNTDFRDVPFFVNHNTKGIPLARSRNNNENSTMQLKLDDKGLGFRMDLDVKNNSEARALYSAVERGDITGMSFMMIGVKDIWENARSAHPFRHITGIDRIAEISAVTNPAYKQTSIENRDNSGALDSALESLESAKLAEEEEERATQAAERRTAVLDWLENYKKEVRKE